MSAIIAGPSSGYEVQVARLIDQSKVTFAAFDPVVIDFIDSVSKAVLLDTEMCRLPEMAAVAHWMRKGHLSQLKKKFEDSRGGRIWLPRGIVLHFAPSNVDSIFLYSWFLSSLMGNANIVRLSQHRGAQVDLLLQKIDLTLAQGRFAAMQQRNLVLTYDHDDEITHKLSSVCHVRVIWGGDESVRRLRAVPMNPLGSEIVFANCFSLAVIKAPEVVRTDADGVAALASRFFNDAYWFDQLACSSPRLIVWVGDKSSCNAAKQRFWSKLQEEIAKHSVRYPEVIGINKLVTAYVSAGLGISDYVAPNASGLLTRVHLTPGAELECRDFECGGGIFFEAEIPELDQLRFFLTQRDQTLSYFGFDRDDLRNFVEKLPSRAVDRVVPIGSALNFSVIWDGYDLFQAFSREVELL
jgi:hypothetical protein